MTGPRFYRKVTSNGKNCKYRALNIPVALCNELGINEGTPVYMEKAGLDSILVGIVRRS
jgi:hypothetical protein